MRTVDQLVKLMKRQSRVEGFLVSPRTLIVAAVVFILAVLNTPFWQQLYHAVAPQSSADWVFITATSVAIAALFALVLTLFAVPYLLKGLVAILLIATAALSYLMSEYGIVIDASMVRNAVETTTAEASDLTTASLFGYICVFGVIPAAIAIATPLRWPAFWINFRKNLVFALASAAIAAVIVATMFADFSSVFRSHKNILLSLAPANAIGATVKFARQFESIEPADVADYGTDAHKVRSASGKRRPIITVVVVGETARADHFSLNGYARDTNPKLQAIPGLISFANVSSCGTNTAVSVPCMFSAFSRNAFSNTKAAHQEGLLDVAKHAGVSVLWRENQMGCKGVCDRVPTETLTAAEDPRYCHDGECFDEILLDQLEAKLGAIKNDGLIVLHTMGSHGPAYFKRYPASAKRFTPTCETAQFSHCTTEELVNAYDNTIAYADTVLAKLIAILQKHAAGQADTAMIYISDHGESLGESGLYLHGMPYALAPRAQTHVPMLMWFSDNYTRDTGTDESCLKRRASSNTYSHDNLFHTVLGLLRIESKVYDPSQDIVAGCRTVHPS